MAFSLIYPFHYLFKRESTQFFTSIFIRFLALGMILIFEPIYLYFYFGKSLSLTLVYFGAIHGLYALLAVFGGRIMAKLGFDQSMLLSHFFFFGYYLLLFFIYSSIFLLPLAIIVKALGMMLFWPPFHTDFTRFADKNHRGFEVGKKKVAIFTATVLGPVIGGWILSSFGYPVLFIAVLVVLLISAVPLFFNKEKYEIYTDTYQKAWQRIFKKGNQKISLGLASLAIESGVNVYLWPLFMAILMIGYTTMGGITSFAFFIAALFTLYIGKISDTTNRPKLLNIGSLLTSISWLIKYFVVTPFTALLAQSFYRTCRATADVPFQTLFYEKAALKGAETDEFIIYREIIINISRFFSLIILAGIFLIFPKVTLGFILASIASLGFMFLGKLPKIDKKVLLD